MSNNNPILRLGKVTSVVDNTDSNRIRVQLLPADAATKEKDAYAIPLLPQLIHMKPKVGEAVLVLTFLGNKDYSQRFYIGPVISQISHMFYESFETSKTAMLGSDRVLDPAITKNQQSERSNNPDGTTPTDEDVAISSRKNSDIILADNDLRIRCGVKEVDELDDHKFSFNGTDSAFIKLKYSPEGISGLSNTPGTKCHSTATVVADKINLLKPHGEAVEPEELIDDEAMVELVSKAHELPYGDKLIQFLDLFRKAFLSHTHPLSIMPPCKTHEREEVLENYNLNSLLSDTVRID